MHSLKPNKTAFIWYRWFLRSAFAFTGYAILFAILTAVTAISAGVLLVLFIALYILGRAWTVLVFHIQYNKTEFIFEKHRIIQKTGSIFSDAKTELVLKNVTHVGMRLPWIENKLFGTGSVSVQSAGSAIAEVGFMSIDHPEEIYAHVVKMLQDNGFKLTHKKLLHQESPDPLGVFFETMKILFSTLVVVGILGFNIFPVLFLVSGPGVIALIVIAVLFFIGLLIHGVLRFLDLKERTYNVYEDMIMYREGFLTRNHTIIPIENLSDAETTQTLVDRIFGLYDVKISSQGTGKEILFKNMRRGKELERTLDELIVKSAPVTSRTKKKAAKKKAARKKIAATSFTAALRMDGWRTIVPALGVALVISLYFLIQLIAPILLLGSLGPGGTGFAVLASLIPIFFVTVAAVAGPAIKVIGTKYQIKHESFEERFKFISARNTEFTNDKIMAIKVRRSVIDWLFRTMSVHFWSIGSSKPLVLRNIAYSKSLLTEILKKLGLDDTHITHTIQSRFSLSAFMRAWIFSTIGLGIAAFAVAALAIAWNAGLWLVLITGLGVLILVLIYKHLFYERSRVELHKNHVRFQTGLLIQDQYFALYDNVKDLTTVRYPLSDLGRVRFNVAGEQLVQKGKNQQIVSNTFAVHYVEGVSEKDEFLDFVFLKRPTTAQIKTFKVQRASVVLKAKPSVANTLTGVVILLGIIDVVAILGAAVALPLASIIGGAFIGVFVLLAIFNIVAIGFEILRVRMISYIIEPERVIKLSGIIYRKQRSTLFIKVDYINSSQGMFNKLFRNGNITINTTGSSRPEITVRNIPEYKKFYDVLKKHY